MAGSILIEGKIPGQRRPLFPDWRMTFPPELDNTGGRMALRDLIARVVREEVGAFQTRQAEARLFRALTAQDIARGLMKGKVDMGGRDAVQAVNVEEAIGTALQAFEDGLYYVFVDDEQQTDLEQEVTLRSESRVTFLRLVALAGG
jgi:hypothetical protein